jgi:hypothetical protein
MAVIMANEFDSFSIGLAMPTRLDGRSSHIAPRTDYALPAMMSQLRILGRILTALSFAHLLFVAVGLLILTYILTYYCLIQAFDFPKDFSYLKIDEIHRKLLNHPIDDRDVAYFFAFVFVFIADNVVWRAAKCMRTAKDHSMAVIGAFVACIPVFNTISVPFALMALLYLLKPTVEKKFH